MKFFDFVATLLAWAIGALCISWTHNWLAGLPACLAVTCLYSRFVRERVEDQVTRRQRAYDASPDGRLTRHH